MPWKPILWFILWLLLPLTAICGTDMHNPVTNGVVFSGAKMEKPSCFDNVKRGFMMGCFIGISAGVLLGGFSGLRHGLRGRELIGQVGQAMVQGGGTLGTLMSIRVAIRC